MTIKIKKFASYWGDFLLDLLFPIECLGCGKEGVWLCDDCLRKIDYAGNRRRCISCRAETDFKSICPRCRADFFLDDLFIAGSYGDKILPKLIKQFKYRFTRNIDKILARILALHIRDLINRGSLGLGHRFVPEDYLFIPVPLHRRRFNWRGFNQAELISLKLSGFMPIKIDSSGLVRFRYTAPQAKLDRRMRQENLMGSFRWKGPWLEGRKIVLLDDVATTASTLNECARVLKENGAGAVYGLACAGG